MAVVLVLGTKNVEAATLRLLSRLLLTCAGVLACGAAGIVNGASPGPWPDRPLRLLVPFAPGGGVDTFARTISPRLSTALGHQWVIDNRPGAAGNIATEIVVKANPDGHTVLLGPGTTLTVNPALYKLPFDVATDLRPVVMLTASQYMMVAHPSLAATSCFNPKLGLNCAHAGNCAAYVKAILGKQAGAY